MKNNDKRDFKPLYVPWYETEFQADRTVKRMTSRQRAFYRNLLMDCYFGNERPYLPADDDELWLIADADTKQEWMDNKALIMTKFTVLSRDGELLLSNKRVMEEWQIIEDFLAQKKKAGLASAAGRRRQNGATTVQQPVNTRPTSVRQPDDSLLNERQRLSTDKDVDVNEDGNVDSDGKEKADQHQTVAAVVGERPSNIGHEENRSAATNFPDARTALSDSEIMGEYTTKMLETTGELLEATARHRKAAIEFFRKHGRYVAMTSWEAYLRNYPQKVTTWDDYGETHEEFRKWPLQHFIDSGAAEDYAQDIKRIKADELEELAEARAAGTAAPPGTFAGQSF